MSAHIEAAGPTFEAVTFINQMFGSLDVGEVGVSVPKATAPPGYPTSVERFSKTFHRLGGARKAYVSTASLRPVDGELRNRYDNFCALHFIVLDDIGGKCPIDKLPEPLRAPTYIIESSEGNYQYGYKLAEPIRDVDDARILIGDIYSVGEWDSGGATAAKYVRLPIGVHGKTDFNVRLVEMHPERVFTPAELRDAAGVDVSTNEAQARRSAVRYARTRGHQMINCDGIVDDLLEKMVQAKMVLNDNGAWVQLKCPWVDEHSGGDDSGTYYKPVGRGDNADTRGFKCNHDACSSRRTVDLLSWAEETFGKKFSIYDPAAELARDWIHVPGHGYVNLQNTTLINKTDFDEKFAERIAKQKLCDWWRQHPMRRSLDGAERRPDTSARIVDGDGRSVLNTFTGPPWSEVEVDRERLDVFFELVEYLFPVEEEREYVLNWMAKKLQDPLFRGAVIVCVAQAEGTGRTTFWNIFKELIGVHDSTSVSFKQLLGEFDDHLQYGFALCDEASDDSNALQRYTTSDTLKQRCDPAAQRMHLNIKSKPRRDQLVTTSLVMCTNNADAMSMGEGSRRLYVARNPSHARDEMFYRRVNVWRDRTGWQDHLYSWFRSRDVSEWDGMAQPPMTEGKAAMIDNTTGDIGKMVATAVELWEADYIARAQVTMLVEDAFMLMGQEPPKSWRQQVQREFMKHVDMHDCLGQSRGVDLREKTVANAAGELKSLTAHRIKLKMDGPPLPKVARVVDWNALVSELAGAVD